jgi:hypothetical protein
MRRSARSHPLTLPRLMFYAFISPFVLLGVMMLGVLVFGLLSFLVALVTAAVAP